MERREAISLLKYLGAVAAEVGLGELHRECLGVDDEEPVQQLESYLEYLAARIAIVADEEVESAKRTIAESAPGEGPRGSTEIVFRYLSDDRTGAPVDYVGWAPAREVLERVRELQAELFGGGPAPTSTPIQTPLVPS